MAEQQQDSLSTLKQNLIEYVQLQLASQIIDLELDPEQLIPTSNPLLFTVS